MKKKLLCIAVLILTVAVIFTGCGKKSYGTPFADAGGLKTELKNHGVDLLYPQYLGEQAEKDEYKYIGVRDLSKDEYVGYKIYNFGSPFFVLVTAYNYESQSILSEDVNKITKIDNLSSTIGDIQFYHGTGHKEALFLIGSLDIQGKHYECRVTANKKLENGESINAIYPDNDKYILAKDLLVSVIESIK